MKKHSVADVLIAIAPAMIFLAGQYLIKMAIQNMIPLDGFAENAGEVSSCCISPLIVFWYTKNKKLLLLCGIVSTVVCTLLIFGTMSVTVFKLVAYGAYGSINEEIIYRGVVLENCRSMHGSIYGVTISSILFAAAHPIGPAMIVALLAGVILGFVKVKTDCIHIPILLHSAWNVVAVIMSA